MLLRKNNISSRPLSDTSHQALVYETNRIMVSFKTTALIFSLASVVSSLPWDNRGMIATVLEDTLDPTQFGKLHGQVIHAAAGKFWIGAATAATCPPANPGCTTTKDTVIHVWLETTMSLDTTAANKIFKDPTGALLYTAPNAMTPGSVTRGFRVKVGTFGGNYVYHEKGGNWIACPILKGRAPYQVFFEQSPILDMDTPTGRRADCLGISISIESYTGPTPAAYQYTPGAPS
ncbi:hypothetical protein TWF694_007215 [Orbilia ellipsospora]|uniref:Uncharacterized protein n=1 Tax=Orbilia ellipsospora TaxID=2528407 RepID=A0AAV9XH24_9PEZI